MHKSLLIVVALLLPPMAAAAAMALHVTVGERLLVDGTKLAGGASTLVADGWVSMYLLDAGPGQVALIDCGNDADGAAILKALAARGLGLDAVKAVFLTHGHEDHVAGCHLFPSAEIYAFPGDVKLAAGEETSKGPLARRLPTPKEKTVKVTKTLEDGQVVRVGSVEVKAYAVPGHTAGSAAYLSRGVLYLGDNAASRSSGTSLKHADWFYSDDVVRNLEELDLLHARLIAEHQVVNTLAFAHSGPLDGVELLLTAH